MQIGDMKYKGKEYRWFQIMFEDGKPEGVVLFTSSPYEYNPQRGSITTFWDNEQLTDKPQIV